MFERFTDSARLMVRRSQEFARDQNHKTIGTMALFVALLQDPDSVATVALENLGVTESEIVRYCEPHDGERATGHMPFTPTAKKALENALREALQLGHSYIGPEHIVLALAQDAEIKNVLMGEMGVSEHAVRRAVVTELSIRADAAQGERQREHAEEQHVRVLTQFYVSEKALDAWQKLADQHMDGDAAALARPLRTLCDAYRHARDSGTR